MEQNININDSADLYAYTFVDNAPVSVDDLLSVLFQIEKPDGTRISETGSIEDDGAGHLMFNDTDQVGEYKVIATFTFTTGRKKSERADFDVDDPFTPLIATDAGVIEKLVWDKFEDLFDSRDGGPWLKEMTRNIFDQNKISDFIDDALLEINVYQPPTQFGEDLFVQVTRDVDGNIIDVQPNTNSQILVLGTFLATVRHLMRSYTEQPLPSGGQITYEDRRDYLQRWGTVYQIESQRYDSLLKLWKRQFLSMNQGKVLVSSKAGRLTPAPLRSRNIGRGYY